MKNHGFSLVEVLLAVSVFGLMVTGLIGGLIYGQQSTQLAGQRVRAVMLADEGLEAVRNIRDANFANLADGTYGLTTTGNQWNLSGSSDTTDIFTRAVTISTVDTNRKSITSSVAWQQNVQRGGLVSLATRLSYWMKVVGSWASPTQAASIDLSGNQDGVKVQVQGNYAYLVRSNASNNFVVIDVTNPSAPSTLSTISITGKPTNIYVSGNYAYVTSNDNSQELQIIDISSPSSPSVVGSYNASGNADANGVYVVGNTAYVVRANSANAEFSIVNVTNHSSPAELGTLDLGAVGYEVVVSGNYAYAASGSNSQEVQVVDISSPSAPFLSGPGMNLSSNTDATTIAFSGTTLFVGQGTTLYDISVSNPLLPVNLGSISTSDTLSDIALNLGNGGTYVYIATTDNSLEFQVIDVTTPATPVLLGSVNTPGNDNLSGIAYDATLDRAFGVGAGDANEFLVFSP